MNQATPQGFSLGWNPARAVAARQSMYASGRYATVIPFDLATLPPAWSISRFRLRHLEQGQAGTCWEHAATQLVETSSNAMGYEAFPICRRLVGWQGKQLEGGGNQADGGNPTDALMGMTDSDKGVGIAHESLLPYTDNNGVLAQKPPANVFSDASACHLVLPVDVRSNDEARALIAANHGAANGQWWPFGWDNQQTFMTEVGSGTYGHALYEIGYALPGVFDEYAWWQIDNWHGLLYPPLPLDKAAKVPGYVPITADRTSDFWVRDDVYQQVKDMGNFEHVSATDVNGLKKKIVETNWDGIFV